MHNNMEPDYGGHHGSNSGYYYPGYHVPGSEGGWSTGGGSYFGFNAVPPMSDYAAMFGGPMPYSGFQGGSWDSFGSEYSTVGWGRRPYGDTAGYFRSMSGGDTTGMGMEYGGRSSGVPGTHSVMGGLADDSDPSGLRHGLQAMSLSDGANGGVDGEKSSAPTSSSANSGPKTWANIASAPAKQQPPSLMKVKNTPSATGAKGLYPPRGGGAPPAWGGPAQSRTYSANRPGRGGGPPTAASNGAPLAMGPPMGGGQQQLENSQEDHPVLKKLKEKQRFNPGEFNLDLNNARFFVIKSYSEDDIHRSIKYAIWCSTEHGNRRLDAAFRSQNGSPIYLLFSVNGSGHFCGVARMMSAVDQNSSSSVWQQGEKWKGRFDVQWIYVKDVPNHQLRHIRLENNENKPVTNSRDTQEVFADKGRECLHVIHRFKHQTSIFDDFSHYEKLQEDENRNKSDGGQSTRGRGRGGSR